MEEGAAVAVRPIAVHPAPRPDPRPDPSGAESSDSEAEMDSEPATAIHRRPAVNRDLKRSVSVSAPALVVPSRPHAALPLTPSSGWRAS